jgi:hypothetical protein
MDFLRCLHVALLGVYEDNITQTITTITDSGLLGLAEWP